MTKPPKKQHREKHSQDEPTEATLRDIPELPPNARTIRRGPRDLVYTLGLLREAAGSTQAEVAEAMGVSQARVSQIESASLDELDPQWSTLTRYAAALGGKLELRVVIGGRAYRVR